MSMVSKLKARIESALGVQIKKMSRHGHYLCNDLKKTKCPVNIIFDVGAHIGESTEKFKIGFSGARVFCFEPVAQVFNTLSANVAGLAGVSCHNLALGSINGEMQIYMAGASNTNSLIKPETACKSETVAVQTLCGFAESHSVPRIDLLKIDAEGFDLEVLKGAEAMLAGDCIPFVVVEAGLHPQDDRHIVFDEIRDFLMPFGYAVFGFYDQQPEWSGEARLRYANICFSKESAFSARH